MNEYSDHEIRMMKIACLGVGLLCGVYFGAKLFAKTDVYVLVDPKKDKPDLKIVENEPVHT